MERLVGTPELMDGPLDGPVLAGNLRDLARVNRYLGGTRLSGRAMDRLLPDERTRPSCRLLDIGTGSADIPAALIDRYAKRGITLTVHAIDDRTEMVAAARVRVGARSDLTLEVTDGSVRLPYHDGTFDVAHCSLLLHHLRPDAATGLLREAARVSRLGVIVNDLDRAAHFWVGAWLLSHLLTRNRYTRHDAPLSVRRAYRVAEVEGIAAAAGLERTERLGGFLGHRYALVFVSSDHAARSAGARSAGARPDA